MCVCVYLQAPCRLLRASKLNTKGEAAASAAGRVWARGWETHRTFKRLTDLVLYIQYTT